LDVDLDKITIREIRNSDSLEDLTELLHRSYKALADMGLKYLATHQDISVTRDRIKLGTCFVAESEGQVVGTITYHDPGHVKGSKWMERDFVAHLNQLAVEPNLQGHGIATRLVEHAEDYARSRGITEIALDTAEPAEQLISWYQKMGYRFVEFTDWAVTNYRSVVMSKTL